MTSRSRFVATLIFVMGAAIAAPALAQPAAAGKAGGPDNPYVPPACSGIFSDVACPGGFAVNWIEQFYGDGITAGCGTNPLRYCPDATVTRAQMAVFVEKAMRGTAPWSPGDLGNQNTGIGAGSLPFSAYGPANTAFGASALAADGLGDSNTAVGASALKLNTTGSGNTAVGDQALYPNTNGQDNTAVGLASLGSNTLGSDNTAVGVVAMEFNTTAGRNTAVGSGALQSQSYDPGYNWVSNNTAVGSYALTSNQPDGGNGNLNGTNNTAVGVEALEFNTTGYYDTAVGVDAYCDATDQVRLGNFYVGSIGGKVGWSALSDARAKENIHDLDLGLGLVMQLRPVSFRYKGGNGRTDMGFVAQDVEALLGDGYNVLGIGGDTDRTLSLRYTDLIAPLVKAVQEQQATIEAQRAQIEALKAQHESEMEAVLARVAKLEATAQRERDRPAAVE